MCDVRDENISKNGRRPVENVSGRRRPVKNISLVNVDQLKTSVWSTSTSRKHQSGWRRPVEKQRQSGRRRPVEKVSLVDVDK